MTTACQHGLWEELPEHQVTWARNTPASWMKGRCYRSTSQHLGYFSTREGLLVSWLSPTPRSQLREEMQTSFPMSDSHLLPLSGSKQQTLLSLIKAFCTNYRSESCPLRWLAWNRDLSGCQYRSWQQAFMHNLIWTWQTLLWKHYIRNLNFVIVLKILTLLINPFRHGKHTRNPVPPQRLQRPKVN